MRFERPVSPPPCKNNTLFILSSNQIFAAVFSQHRFHLIQAFDSGAHLHLITRARCFDIHNLATKIQLHLSLFLGDNGLDDGRGLLWGDVDLP